jgi:ornithine cyclodeaminase/alanine dehydrogenase-like protein (mu-crystallin family)
MTPQPVPKKVSGKPLADDEAPSGLPWFSAVDLFTRMPISSAIDSIETVLKNGHDPANDVPRTIVDTAQGQLIMMPAESDARLGVKIASVAPKNPNRALPRIQAIYLLMDSETLTPLALFDGTALTTLRTSAVSALAAKYLSRAHATRLLLFGSGPQARGHLDAMRSIRGITRVTIVANTQPNAEVLAIYGSSVGLETRILQAEELTEINREVAEADIIVCATSSSTPLFSGRYVSEGAHVCAIGSHEPRSREVDGSLVGRSTVVVEDQATSLRESGDILMAIEEGVFSSSSMFSISDLVRDPSGVINNSRPSLFKSSGMAWEDLAVAERAFRQGP